MLDQQTKRNIDNARQILVGKVPDPKAQVEQITIALIYKFMDDMDKESKELGGKPKFFAGNFARYSWTNLLDRRLSGQERFDLYTQAIDKMYGNPNIPQLFQDIFKGFFLPYRDTETLNLFLKEINQFTYDHSENLGNAFEYLLSILGSQGDAGQFRTPRHIIDFIVAVVNPQADETILDPACGTAGFLISAYKHIIKINSDVKRKMLTAEQKKHMMENIIGYDISPDMVKLSLANMYLHQFQTPKIYEYDSLTSEDRWDEKFDVIMANPPFMTPKGGIRPHSKFSIAANRSEVLFVDYIAEHLRLNGRAGIIVPEGIIFQSSHAYKNLRKMLIESSLWAVVSLPSGVFKPYSGVKTSILFLDKNFAKQTQEILFVKIENDGFDLGDQRRKIDKNDLPSALEFLEKWQQEKIIANNAIAHAVNKAEIIKTGEYNLTGERYRKQETPIKQKWQMVELGEVCEIYNGATPSRSDQSYWDNGTISWFTIDDIRNQGRRIIKTTQKITQKALEKTSVKLLPPKTILLCCTASVGEYAITEIEITTNQQFNGLVVKKEYRNKLHPEFLFNLSKTFKKELLRLSGKTSFNFVSVGTLKKITIPLPPLEIQQQIVAAIEEKQKAIDHAKEIIGILERERRRFGKSLEKLDDVEWVELGKVCEINPKKSEVKNNNFEVSFVPMTDIKEQDYYFKPKQEKKISEVYKGYTYFAENDVLLAKITPCFENGKSAIARKLKNNIGFGSTEFIVLRANNKLLPEWVYSFIANTNFINEGKNHMTGSAGQKRLDINFVRKYKIPLPPLEIQRQLVAAAEKEQEIINANKRLIEIMENKISTVIDEAWEKQ